MKFVTDLYTNYAINYQPDSIGCTVDTTIKFADGTLLGGCDHFMKKSFKDIVTYYHRRAKRDGQFGRHTITITTIDAGSVARKQDFTIEFTASL